MRNVERLRPLWRTKRQKLRLRQLGAHLLYERLAPRVRSLKKGGRVCKKLLRKEIAIVMIPLTQFGVRKLLCSTKSTGLVGMVSLTGEATQQPNERLDGWGELREHWFKRVGGVVRVSFLERGGDKDTVEFPQTMRTKVRVVAGRPTSAARRVV